MNDLWAALCLVAVLEGLVLFASPGGWKRAVQQLSALPERQLRVIGGIFLAIGLASLYVVRASG